MIIDCKKGKVKETLEHIKADDPLVSIITPLYNAKDYIMDTADSVLSQTITDFEWIIINDCSTDNSLEIVQELSERDVRIKVITLEKNSGPIVARNSGLKVAKGQYIAFVDSDDIWLPKKLEEQIKVLREKKAPLSYTCYKKIDSQGELKNNRLMMVPESVSYRDTLKSDSIVASSAIYDTNITGRIYQSDESPIGKDDFDFFLSILKKHGNAVGVQKDLVRLRIHGDSLTGNKMVAAKKQWLFYYKYLGLNLFKSFYLFTIYAFKGFIKYIS